MRTIDLSTATWHKSSHSNQDGGACVEVSHSFADVVPVRDSKHQGGPALTFTAADWSSFVSAVKDGTVGA
ncbi:MULTISPECIES: DUF397 domain-containing protein [unclassified Streptomyces]|uniref:DUF397 domain-containing protein n=1 Tax=unclassified Streptomyces TaxID=2593676 RepID=UPI000DAC8E22|nr:MULTISPECIES: DUF397 domain-containing protein [unclassified Streptomyces]PZT74745.1 DUF397 domain-containing protein [Streptomyces sp. AC1-42T]PZT82270.1 DUF397 domain-containing protein [Streptomyces sp. AC1-42W]